MTSINTFFASNNISRENTNRVNTLNRAFMDNPTDCDIPETYVFEFSDGTHSVDYNFTETGFQNTVSRI